MNTDPTTEDVTARIVFTGVMLMCINDYKQCEVGMIQCPSHKPTITIKELKAGAVAKECKLTWPTGHDLIFKVNKPQVDGVVLHPNATGDASFDKVIDLEGPDLHNGQVNVQTPLLNGRRLGLTAGKLYTHKLNPVALDLVTWVDASDPGTLVKTLGTTAEEVGLNIVCLDEDGSGIDVVDSVSGDVIKTLPRLADTTYHVEVNNDCRLVDADAPPPPPAPSAGTDFRFFYDVISSPDGRKFDLSITVNPLVPPPPFPGVCELGFLSETTSIGLVWPKP